MARVTESTVEDAALAWLEAAGWRIAYGPDIAPDQPRAERRDYGEVILKQRLRDALARLNPALPAEALEDAFRKLTRPEGAELIQRNRAAHRLLVDGVTVEYRDRDGAIRGAQARVLDFDDPANNDWLAVNQFSVTERRGDARIAATRRPDVVLFVNGLPLAVIELKNAADEEATIWSAFQQLQTYKAEIPSLFATNALLVISDGVQARVGTLTAGREWFMPWRMIGGEALGLTGNELAFYDALETNDSAVKVLGDDTLRTIARELVATVRKNVTIDWTMRENVRAQLRVLVKRILRKYGYPPDKQEKATQTALEQAELLSAGWAGA